MSALLPWRAIRSACAAALTVTARATEYSPGGVEYSDMTADFDAKAFLATLEAAGFTVIATPSAEQKVAIYDEADDAMKAYENWLEETGRDGSDDLRDAFLWGRASRPGAEQKVGLWMPIETAPKDGRPVLLWWRGCTRPHVGHHTADETGVGWRCDGDGCIPKNQQDCTHWQPLPAPPSLPRRDDL